MMELSPRQRAILVAMHKHGKDHDNWPSRRELCDAGGFPVGCVITRHLSKLEKAGLIHQSPRRPPKRSARSARPNYQRLAFVTIGGVCEPYFIKDTYGQVLLPQEAAAG